MCYNPVSSCWYAHLCFIFCFIFCFCLLLNPTVVTTAEVRLIYQQGMDYCCIYHGHMFLTDFILLPEHYSCAPGAINCNKEYMKIMSSVTQDYDNKNSDVLLSILECDKVDRRGEKGNKERWYCGFCANEYNIWNSKKALMHLTRSGGHIIYRCRGKILPKYQRQLKALKEKKNSLGIKGYQKGICCRHRFILM